jgi:cytochrome P450
VNPEAYKPFGDGSRKCIGYRWGAALPGLRVLRSSCVASEAGPLPLAMRRFALLEATLAVVKLYQSFTFRLLPGQVPLKVRTVLTLGPADGVQVTVHPRS